jgi:thiamine biosynthesis lipoprotein
LKLINSAVATSGDYRRFVLVEGEKHSHIIDPAGGQTAGGARGGLLSSVTVIAEPPLGGLDADALATAVSVMGAQAGLALVEELGHVEAIVISLEGGLTLAKTSGAERYLK